MRPFSSGTSSQKGSMRFSVSHKTGAKLLEKAGTRRLIQAAFATDDAPFICK